MTIANAAGDKLPMFVIGKVKKLTVLQEREGFTLCITEMNKKVEWMKHCLKSGLEEWTRNFLLKEKKLLQ